MIVRDGAYTSLLIDYYRKMHYLIIIDLLYSSITGISWNTEQKCLLNMIVFLTVLLAVLSFP